MWARAGVRRAADRRPGSRVPKLELRCRSLLRRGHFRRCARRRWRRGQRGSQPQPGSACRTSAWCRRCVRCAQWLTGVRGRLLPLRGGVTVPLRGGVTVPLRGGVTVPLRGRSGAGPRCAHADGRTGADSGKSGCWMAPHTRRKGADRLSVQLAADRAANRWGKVTPSNTALIGSQVSVGAGASVTFFLDAGRAPPCCMSWAARACSANAIPTSTARRSWADWQQRPVQF